MLSFRIIQPDHQDGLGQNPAGWSSCPSLGQVWLRPQCGTLMRSPCLSYLLSPSEKLHLVLYHILWFERFGVQAQHDPNAIFNLADNPLNRVSWSACGKLPGFRRSAGRYWQTSQPPKA